MRDDEVLAFIREKGEVLQKDLWKEMGIDSRECSRILKKLEEGGMVERERVVADGVVTFKITPISEPRLNHLPPCFGCMESYCEPRECNKLDVWVWTVSFKGEGKNKKDGDS